jgi:hypothetical protein
MTERRKVRISKGPKVYLEALATGDPELIAEAKKFQREAFRAQVGCYLEEVKCVACGTPLGEGCGHHWSCSCMDSEKCPHGPCDCTDSECTNEPL